MRSVRKKTRRSVLIVKLILISSLYLMPLSADEGKDIGFSTLLFETHKATLDEEYIKIQLTASAGQNTEGEKKIDLGMLVEFSFREKNNYYYYSYPAKLINYDLKEGNQVIYSDGKDKIYLQGNHLILRNPKTRHKIKLSNKEIQKLLIGMRYGNRVFVNLKTPWKNLVEKW